MLAAAFLFRGRHCVEDQNHSPLLEGDGGGASGGGVVGGVAEVLPTCGFGEDGGDGIRIMTMKANVHE